MPRKKKEVAEAPKKPTAFKPVDDNKPVEPKPQEEIPQAVFNEAAALLINPAFKRTHQHKKGGFYQKLGVGILTDKALEGETLTFYISESGILYARPSRLFNETDRFIPLEEKTPTE